MPADMIAYNATASAATMINGGPLLLTIAILMFIVIFISIPFIYRRILKMFGWLGRVTIYFFKGLGAILAVTAIYFVTKGGASNPEATWEIIKWIIICIAGFFTIALIGLILTKIWNQLQRIAGNREVRHRKRYPMVRR